MFPNIYSLVTSQSINSTLSGLISYLRYKFSECLLKTLLAAFLAVCCILQMKDESVRFFLCTSV